MRRLQTALAALALAGCAHTQDETVHFAAAYLSGDEIRFEPFVPIDWRAVATRARVGFEIDALTSADIAALRERIDMFDNAETMFRFAGAAGEGPLFLIGVSGISEITVSELEGVVRISFDRATPPAPQDALVYGAAISRATEAGFVMRGAHPRRVAGTRVTNRWTDGAFSLEYAADGVTHSVRLAEGWRGAIESAYGFTAGNGHYLFVSWAPEASGEPCEDIFTLHRVEDVTLRQIEVNAFNCDV